MRQVYVTCLDQQVSVAGFGCASLGSRVGARAGLVALERAYQAGVTWYDVAPSYGDALAETILAEFLAGKRDRIQVCTKVGIRPAQTPTLMRVAKPVMRATVGAFPLLRKYVSRARPKALKVALSADLIASSIVDSLRRLRTDYVDVLALHGPAPDEVVRDDVVTALERVLREGKVRAVSIAGSLEAGLAGFRGPAPYRFIQVANNPFEPSVVSAEGRIAPGNKATFVTHSAFSELERLAAMLAPSKDTTKVLSDAGYRGSNGEIAGTLLADYAFSTNPAGVTLVSMFKKEHLDFNVARLEQPPGRRQVEAIFAAILRSGPQPNQRALTP